MHEEINVSCSCIEEKDTDKYIDFIFVVRYFTLLVNSFVVCYIWQLFSNNSFLCMLHCS